MIDINKSYHTSGSDVYLPPEEFTKMKPSPDKVPVNIHDKPTTLTHRIMLAVRAAGTWKIDVLVSTIRRVLHDEFQRNPDEVRQWLETVPMEDKEAGKCR